MTAVATTAVPTVEVNEPFRHYAVDWERASMRTDTPDLISLFQEVLQAQAYREMTAEYKAAAQDMAPLSFRTLPSE